MRVRVTPALVPSYDNTIQSVVAINIQNRSMVPVYLGNVLLGLIDGRVLLFPRDSLTGASQGRRRLDPGEAYMFQMDPAAIFEKIDPAQVRGAGVRDDIDRAFCAPKGEATKVLSVLYQLRG